MERMHKRNLLLLLRCWMFLYDLINCVNIEVYFIRYNILYLTEKFCYLLFHTTYWISSCNRVRFCYRWNAETNWNFFFIVAVNNNNNNNILLYILFVDFTHSL